jgi:hypothetical protein
MINDMLTFIQDNPLPAALIGVAVLLLIALLVLLVIWLGRRNRQTERTVTADYGASVGEVQPSAQGFALGNSGGFGGGLPGSSPASVSSASPTIGMGATPAASATSAPTALPDARPNYVPPPPFVNASPALGGVPQPLAPGGRAQVGRTVVLDRSPKPKHVAILIDRRDASKRHDLRAETDIGRAQTSAIAIADTTVSRQHARIRLQDDRFELFDLASANGTFINGQKVEQPRTLTDGDVVRFGDVEFVFKQLT